MKHTTPTQDAILKRAGIDGKVFYDPYTKRFVLLEYTQEVKPMLNNTPHTKFKRVGEDIKVYVDPYTNRYVLLEQADGSDNDKIIITVDELDDLITVLKVFKEAITRT